MAKERTITRTIETTRALVFVLDVTTGETTKDSVFTTGNPTDDELLGVAKERMESDSVKVVAIVPNSKEHTSGLYEVKERDFLQIATRIGDGR